MVLGARLSLVRLSFYRWPYIDFVLVDCRELNLSNPEPGSN